VIYITAFVVLSDINRLISLLVDDVAHKMHICIDVIDQFSVYVMLVKMVYQI